MRLGNSRHETKTLVGIEEPLDSNPELQTKKAEAKPRLKTGDA